MAAEINFKDYGPLASLIGTWEGDTGDDIAPSDDRGTENNKFREQLIFEPIGGVDNHEQKLFGLKYFTKAWRIGEEDGFHQETGYWLWDKKNQQVMRCFIVPRGVSVIAGATVAENAKEFTLKATRGSTTYGICANQFLDVQFQTQKFEMKVTIHSNDSFSYDEDTQILMMGHKEVFHHTDKNKMRRVSS